MKPMTSVDSAGQAARKLRFGTSVSRGRPESSPGGTSERAQASISGGTIACGLALAVALVLAGDLVISAHHTVSLQTKAIGLGDQPRSPSVIAESIDTSGCRQQTYTDQVDQNGEVWTPCSPTNVLHHNSVPVSIGTIQRLEGISKSFVNR
jgi:hypothetical protein